MKKLYSLAAGLLLAGATLAQPCSTFDGSSPMGNWFLVNATATFGDTNPLDGTGCVHLYDGSGGSNIQNTTDYLNLGQKYVGQCLCFDYFLINDGGSGVPFYPTIYVTDGVNTIGFVSSTAVTPGSGWIHVCAPIQHCTGSLPSNSDGAWQIFSGGTTCADFNLVLDNSTTVYFPTDITSCPCEEMDVDNVCISNCGNQIKCTADFVLKTGISSATGQANADVGIIAPDPSANYVVDWGDGSPLTPPGTPHTYASPGTYVVCVTEYIQKQVICRVCMPFCYGKATTDNGTGTGGGNPQSKTIQVTPVPEVNVRTLNDKKFENEGYAMYPNPSHDYTDLQMRFSKATRVSVKVTDVFGKVVAETSGMYDAGTQKIHINTERVGNGVYTVEINNGGRITTQKLSVSK